MRFELALDLNGIAYYGRVPQFFDHPGQCETFVLEEADWPLLSADFVDSANELCGTLLDNGDVDYFDACQCELLADWLSTRLDEGCNGRLRFLYEKLQGFAERAISLKTGIVVEL